MIIAKANKKHAQRKGRAKAKTTKKKGLKFIQAGLGARGVYWLGPPLLSRLGPPPLLPPIPAAFVPKSKRILNENSVFFDRGSKPRFGTPGKGVVQDLAFLCTL